MRIKPIKRDAPALVRLSAAIAIALCMLLTIVYVVPWVLPYDRLDCLYGPQQELFEVGHPGGEFILYCAAINGSPEIELWINGKPYVQANHVTKEQYSVQLGEELFAQPGELELMLKLRFGNIVSLRSNPVTIIVEE